MVYYPVWVEWLVAVMAICAALLSGIHTVPTVYNGIPQHTIITEAMRVGVAYLSFVAVELSILLSAYLMVRGSYRVAWFVLVVSTGLAMLANVTSVFSALGSGLDVGTISLTAGLGLGAPLIAFMSGKLFVNIHLSTRTLDKKARTEYRAAAVAFDNAVLDAWTVYEDKHLARPTAVQVDNGLGQGTGRGYKRTADAAQLSRDYFAANPDVLMDTSISVRQIADDIGAGKSTVASVRGAMRNELLSEQNGNGGHE